MDAITCFMRKALLGQMRSDPLGHRLDGSAAAWAAPVGGREPRVRKPWRSVDFPDASVPNRAGVAAAVWFECGHLPWPPPCSDIRGEKQQGPSPGCKATASVRWPELV